MWRALLCYAVLCCALLCYAVLWAGAVCGPSLLRGVPRPSRRMPCLPWRWCACVLCGAPVAGLCCAVHCSGVRDWSPGTRPNGPRVACGRPASCWNAGRGSGAGGPRRGWAPWLSRDSTPRGTASLVERACPDAARLDRARGSLRSALRLRSKERLAWRSLVTVGGEGPNELCWFWRLAGIVSSGCRDAMDVGSCHSTSRKPSISWGPSHLVAVCAIRAANAEMGQL